jgi:hypothetical protein
MLSGSDVAAKSLVPEPDAAGARRPQAMLHGHTRAEGSVSGDWTLPTWRRMVDGFRTNPCFIASQASAFRTTSGNRLRTGVPGRRRSRSLTGGKSSAILHVFGTESIRESRQQQTIGRGSLAPCTAERAGPARGGFRRSLWPVSDSPGVRLPGDRCVGVTPWQREQHWLDVPW